MQQEFALLKDGAFVELRQYQSKPESVATHKGFALLPVVRVTRDLSTSEYTKSEQSVSIDGSQYTITTTIVDLPPTQEMYASAIQSHIDATARALGYESGFALATYATSTVVQWRKEAEAFCAWRDSVWKHAYAVLESVTSGTTKQPTIAELISGLPKQE